MSGPFALLWMPLILSLSKDERETSRDFARGTLR